MSKFTPNQSPVNTPTVDLQANSEQRELRSLWAAWAVMPEFETPDWRIAVELTGRMAFNRIAAAVEMQNRLGALVTHIASTDQQLAFEVEDAAMSVFDYAVEKCTLIGYSLARTWPDGIESLERWPDRALDYAGLPKTTGSEEPLGG